MMMISLSTTAIVFLVSLEVQATIIFLGFKLEATIAKGLLWETMMISHQYIYGTLLRLALIFGIMIRQSGTSLTVVILKQEV